MNLQKIVILMFAMILLSNKALFAQSITGSGAEGDPFLVHDAAGLFTIMGDASYWDDYIELAANVDMSGYANCPPIGDFTNGPFTGSFNGNYYLISNVTVTNTAAVTSNYLGFFGSATGATIQKILLSNINVTAQTTGGDNRVGGLVGMVSNCSIKMSGIISGSVTGQGTTGIVEFVGGLVGFAYWNESSSLHDITECFSKASVSVASNIGEPCGGGLIGYTHFFTVTDCYATGSVTFPNATTVAYRAGGLIGKGYYASSANRCYATGDITAPSTAYASSACGLAGKLEFYGSVNNSFALNNHITGGFQNRGFTFRAGYYAPADGGLTNNYGKSDMLLTIGGNDYTANGFYIGVNSFEGGDISITSALTHAASENFYTNSGWSSTSTWFIVDGIYPKLFNAPEGLTDPTLNNFTPNTYNGTSTLTFSENIYFRNSRQENVKIYRASDDVLVFTGSAGTVTVSGATVTVSPPAGTLQGNTAYYMQIGSETLYSGSANAYAGVSDKVTLTFTTDATSFATAASNVLYTSFSANWNAVAGATKYYLDVATNNTFTTLVTGWSNVDVGANITYSVNSALTVNTTYYYRLRSVTGQGTSVNSNIISVTTLAGTPVLADIEGADIAYTERQGVVQITNTITVSDPNDANLDSAIVRITGNYQNGEDFLYCVDQNGITATWNAATGTMTLTGNIMIANYRTALRSVTYYNTSYSPSTLQRTISFTVNDGDYNSNTVTRRINVTSVNNSPVLNDIEESALDYTAGSGSVEITSTMTVSDADNVNLASAIIGITNNYLSTEDELTFTNQNGITGSWDKETGVLTLNGASSVENYQTALRTVGYWNANANPNTSIREISFLVNDGGGGMGNSNIVTRNINIHLNNRTPVLTINSGGVVNEGRNISLNDQYLKASDEDGPVYSIIYNIKQVPQHGHLLVNSTPVLLEQNNTFTQNDISNSIIKYVHNGSESSNDNFTFTLIDSDGNESEVYTFHITVLGINDPPCLTGTPKIEFPEDVPYLMPIDSLYKYIYDSDNSNESLDIKVLTASDSLLCEVSGDTAWVLCGKENMFGKFRTRIQISDGEFEIDTTFYVTVLSVNDLPVLSGIPDNIDFMDTGFGSICLNGCVIDIETPDSLLIYSFYCEPDSLNINYDHSSCTVTFTSKNGFDGNVISYVCVEDADGGYCEAAINISVNLDPTGNEDLYGIPQDYELFQNYPNPFNPSTTIRYGIPADAGNGLSPYRNVSLKIYDILGNEVATLINEQQSPGYYEVRWNVVSLSSGIYFSVLMVNSSNQNIKEVRKLILMK